MEATTTHRLSALLSTDRLLLAAAIVSIGALIQLSVAHSAWILMLLAPLLMISLVWQQQARTEGEGAAQLRTAVAAILAQHQPAVSRPSQPDYSSLGRLRLVPNRAE